jgi:hypothetical protein
MRNPDGDHHDVAALRIDDQEIFASAEGRLDALFDAVSIGAKGRFRSAPLSEVMIRDQEDRYVCYHF